MRNVGKLEMEPEPVYASGRAQMDHADTATAVGERYLRALREATTAVGDPSVAAALERYLFDWQPQVTAVAADIDALGHRTSASAVVVTDADHHGAGILGPNLRRDVNSGS
jgi:hypothetical protein